MLRAHLVQPLKAARRPAFLVTRERTRESPECHIASIGSCHTALARIRTPTLTPTCTPTHSPAGYYSKETGAVECTKCYEGHSGYFQVCHVYLCMRACGCACMRMWWPRHLCRTLLTLDHTVRQAKEVHLVIHVPQESTRGRLARSHAPSKIQNKHSYLC